jgi:hypothetical protein
VSKGQDVKKKLLQLLAACSLMGALMFSGAAPVAASAGGACVTTTSNAFAGIGSSQGSSRNGVQAQIDTTTNFTNCGDISVPSATSAWVGIQGTSGSNQILQLGIVECDNKVGGFPGYCNDTGGPHYFYQKSGCSQGVIVDLGTADFNLHTYKIDRANGTSGSWRLWIDSNLKATIDTSDIDIFCWDESSTKTDNITGERFNRGDAWGDQFTSPVYFNNMQFYQGGAWVVQNVGTACAVTPTTGTGTSHCSRVNGQSDMNIWSVY